MYLFPVILHYLHELDASRVLKKSHCTALVCNVKIMVLSKIEDVAIRADILDVLVIHLWTLSEEVTALALKLLGPRSSTGVSKLPV